MALGMLCFGAVFTQLAEVSGAALLGGKGNVLLGCGLTVLSALLASLPNVFYERLLKTDGQKEWVTNVQLTTWIFIWVCLVRVLDPSNGIAAASSSGGFLASLGEMTHGFTPLVWVITFLKTLNAVIIPLCLKYGDNIIYGYAKPVSIILTCVVTAAITGTWPAPFMVFGVTMVLSSMALYSS